MMKFRAYFILLTVLLSGCQSKQANKENTLPSIYQIPTTTQLNIEDGYKVNPTTLDSILPTINSHGDTVKTGEPHSIESQPLLGDFMPTNHFIPASKVLAEKQNWQTTDSLPIPISALVDKSTLTTVHTTDKTTPFTLVNSLGDTVPTNVYQDLVGDTIPFKQGKTFLAGPALMKDNANLDITTLNIEQGMPGSYICKVFHDKKGRLWIGTFDDGLSVYDGQTINPINKLEGLTDKGVKDIIEDEEGNLWFATSGDGAIKFDGQNFIHFNEDNGFINNNVESVFEDNRGNIWFGTYTGLCSMTGNSCINYTTNEGLSNNVVWSITDDIDGNLWIATLGGGVNCFDGNTFTHYKEQDGLVSNFVWSLFNDKSGILWFGTSNGLSKFDGDSFTNYTTSCGLNSNYINDIYESQNGKLWLGTYGGGVSVLSENTIQSITEKDGLSNNFVYSITQDHHGNMWIGTYGGGLVKYNPNSFQHFTKQNGLTENVYTTITEDSDENIWLGGLNGSVHSLFDEKLYTYQTDINLGMLFSIIEDSLGNIWFGSNSGGIYIYNKTKLGFDHYLFNTNGKSGGVRSIIEDQYNQKWIGTYGSGVYIYNSGSFSALTEADGLPSNFIWSLFEDSKGNIWIGSLDGLSKYNPTTKTIVNYSEKEGLANTQILNIFEDKSGHIWLGTWGGLTKFDGSNFTTYTEKNGLSNNRVWGIREDLQQRLWVSTEKGITMLQSDSKGMALYNFDKPDGLKGSDFYLNSSLMDHNKQLWLGNGQSVVKLNTKGFYINPNPPKIELASVAINSEQYSYRTISDYAEFSFDSVSNYYNVPLGLILNHNQNHLTFHFTAVDVASPHKIKYSYKINELNEPWSTPSPENKADYRNLSYGDYTFTLMAIGEANTWSQPISYQFSITPPWWHMWWARILYAIILLLLIYSFIHWRTAKLKKRQKELEVEVKNATKEIIAQKDEIVKQKDEVEQQKDIIEEAHKEITDSIVYAKRIQSAILPPLRIVKEYLKNSFILYKPKDVVAGDFYWLEHLDSKILFAAADCTGHGVPGAMVSVVCNNALNRTVREYGLSDPGEILTKTRDIVIEEFAKSDEEVKDGMDIALCSINGNQLEYAGAHNPLWIVRKNATEIEEIKADKQPIGKFDKPTPYTTHRIKLNPGDAIYIFSDGYADQFGGEKGKKFKTANFKRLLLSIQDLSMNDQLTKIDCTFEDWKGDLEQLDDVCVIALRI